MARARQARSVETRARLLDAAATVIATNGIDGASVDAIAEAAARTSGSVYGQFGSKEGLVTALLDGSKDVVAARLSDELAAAATLDERLVALWRNFADPPDPARDWVRLEHELWVWATRDGNDRARERLAARYRRELAPLARELAAWEDDGLIAPSLPAEALADAVLAALLGLEMRHRLEPDAVRDDDVVHVLRGVLGVPARATARPVPPTGDGHREGDRAIARERTGTRPPTGSLTAVSGRPDTGGTT